MILAPMLALLTKFLAREAELVVITSKGKALESVPRPSKGRLLVFPGSFDPLHEGHTKLAEAAVDAMKRRDASAIATRALTLHPRRGGARRR